MDLMGEGAGGVGVVNPDGAGLDGSFAGGMLDVPDLGRFSGLGAGENPVLGLLLAAQDVLGMFLEELGLVLFGRGGTAYTVCFDTWDGGAPVGRLDLTEETVDVEVERGPDGLNDFDFWILLTRLSSACRFLRKR